MKPEQIQELCRNAYTTYVDNPPKTWGDCFILLDGIDTTIEPTRNASQVVYMFRPDHPYWLGFVQTIGKNLNTAFTVHYKEKHLGQKYPEGIEVKNLPFMREALDRYNERHENQIEYNKFAQYYRKVCFQLVQEMQTTALSRDQFDNKWDALVEHYANNDNEE